MKDFLSVLDGSEFAPRSIQEEYFKHLTKQLEVTKYHVLSGPPGIGKSYIARTIQRTLRNTAIITPNNALVDQYTNSYKELNGLKGKDYYDEPNGYIEAKMRAEYEDTVFNPLSYYYFHASNKNATKATTVVIDEAHKLADLLVLTLSQSFSCKYYGIPEGLSEAQFITWLGTMVGKLKGISTIQRPNMNQVRLINKFEKLALLYEYLKVKANKLDITYEQRKDRAGKPFTCLVTTPLEVPITLLDTIFGPNTRIILMSGTINQFDIDELLPGKKVDFFEVGALAPQENRLIHVGKTLPKVDRKNLAKQAIIIRDLYIKHKKVNTMIHVSYADAPWLGRELLKLDKKLPIITHKKEDKDVALSKFKKIGGILLASGMAEGVDLPGDACRLLIIPRLLYPNMGAEGVKKRLNLPNGKMWYPLSTMMTTIQQLGRGVRGPTDWCHSYILDSTVARLIDTTNKYLTKDLKDSIVWTSEKK